jgi:hypothetical protein
MTHRIYFFALSFFFLGLTNSTYADYDLDYELNRTLIMQCDYSDFEYENFQTEIVSIRPRIATDIETQSASIKRFRRGAFQKNEKPFLISSGQFAECVYPSGTRVRVKVGEGVARSYGECGADPEVFMSIWVNKRKIASQQFSGHCWHDIGREFPTISFKVSGNEKSVYSVEKCHTAIQQESFSSFVSKISKQIPPKPPLSVCVDFPALSKFPHDFIEYPRKGVKLPKAGDIQLLKGSDNVCQAVRNELKADFHTFSAYPNMDVIKLPRPNWTSISTEVIKGLGTFGSIFDFNNDGNLDRVFQQFSQTNYMDGSILLVQYGSSASILEVSDIIMDKNSHFLPCQMDSVPHKIMDCPQFSQNNDEAGFLMKGRTAKESVYFRGRYTTLTPFSFQGTSFIGVNTVSGDTKNYAAVLKPLPNRKFQQMCLFQRVAEHF